MVLEGLLFFVVVYFNGGTSVSNLGIVAHSDSVCYYCECGEAKEFTYGSKDGRVNVTHRRYYESQGYEHKGNGEAYPKGYATQQVFFDNLAHNSKRIKVL